MPANISIEVGPLQQKELEEADRIFRIAFGTYLGMPNPVECMGDRHFLVPRWHASHVKVLAARDAGRLIGSNAVTRWGSFGFFGPLTVLPEYWQRGIAQALLEATMTIFDQWKLRRTGLFTFSNSPKHVGLYQKFGYWPQYLTALMKREIPETVPAENKPGQGTKLLSVLSKKEQQQAIHDCAKLTNRIDKGLDLTEEILSLRGGDVVLTYTRKVLDAFAICIHGPATEAGEKLCYVKFGAARSGPGAARRFDELLNVCDDFAASRKATLEAGVNLARKEAFQRMRAHGYRVVTQGIAMQRPDAAGFNRADAYVVDDWR